MHTPIGTKVKMRVAQMGIKERGVTYVTGIITARDGEYYTVELDLPGRKIPVERYQCEFEPI